MVSSDWNESEGKRPFEVIRPGGTRVYLSVEELWQRWRDHRCLPSDRVVDRRHGRQFPAASLDLLLELDESPTTWDLFGEKSA